MGESQQVGLDKSVMVQFSFYYRETLRGARHVGQTLVFSGLAANLTGNLLTERAVCRGIMRPTRHRGRVRDQHMGFVSHGSVRSVVVVPDCGSAIGRSALRAAVRSFALIAARITPPVTNAPT